MQFNLKKISIDIGLKLGTLIFVLSALLYIYDLKFFYNNTLSFICIPLILGFGIYSIFNARKLNNQVLSFKDAFTAYFLCIVIGYLIVSLGDILIFRFIDPEAGKLINEEVMIAYKIQSEMLIADGWLTKEDVSMQLEDMQNYPRYSYYSIFFQFMIILLINAFVGLLIALVFKKS